jgi:protein-S-isoprenylcysteine O-methyltransferase Ste14
MSVVASTDPSKLPTPGVPRVWPTLRRFLTRRRVALSTLLFVMLAVVDAAAGVQPRDLFNLHDPFIWVGVTLVVLGVALRSWAVGILRKDDVLTTTGPYGLMRNPLYAGSFLMMFGFCALIGDVKYVWLMIIPFSGLYLLRILVEEQGLAVRFGASWANYVQSTPRIIPRRLWINYAADWRLSKWLGSREYRAVLSALAGLAALQVWHEIVSRG